MPGLDGYKNNDVWSHIDGMVMMAKDTVKEGWNAFTNYDIWDFPQDEKDERYADAAAVNGPYVNKASDYNFTSKDGITLINGQPAFNNYREIIIRAGAMYGVNPALIAAFIEVESKWKPNAQPVDEKTGELMSSAKGLMQILDGTAKELGVKNAFVPEQAIYGGARYIADNMALLKGKSNQLELTIAAYHNGPYDKTIQKGGIPAELAGPKGYVSKVLAHYQRYNQLLMGA